MTTTDRRYPGGLGSTQGAGRSLTLLTDFGQRDPYVGVLHCVLEMMAPSYPRIDLTHELPRHDVGAAAFWLARTFSYTCTASVHVAVVDPGVGTSRRALALAAFGHFFVAPDNGLLTDVVRSAQAEGKLTRLIALRPELVERPGPPASGSTFHGRDLFAPAAAHIARGHALESLGTPVNPEELVLLPELPGRVRVVDHFGNLISDLPTPERTPRGVKIAGREARWVTTYADGEEGELIALAGSWGTVEVAIGGGSAEKELDNASGATLTLLD